MKYTRQAIDRRRKTALPCPLSLLVPTYITSGQLTIIPVGAGSPRYLIETRKPVNPPRPLIAVNRPDMILPGICCIVSFSGWS
jgi:hypothetical protein